MKRVKELRDLSDDHHQGLVLARKAKRASTCKDEPMVSIIWKEIEKKFISDLEPHFQIEETLLAPKLSTIEGRLMLKRFYSDHENLRQFIKQKNIRTATALQSFSILLEKHIRFEERDLFEEAQRSLSQEDLNTIAIACISRF